MSTTMHRLGILLVAYGLSVAPASVQAEETPDHCTILAGATVHTPDGPLPNHTLRLEAGRIVELVDDNAPARPSMDRSSSGSFLDEECVEHELEGAQITAGLIDSLFHLGLREVDLEGRTHDHDAGGADPIRAAFQVIDGYNPRASRIPIYRARGITTVAITPGGGFVSGQVAVVDLAGATQAEALVDASTAMKASAGGGTGGWQRLEELLDDARLYQRSQRAFERNQLRSLGASGQDLAALQPVLDGTMPLLLSLHRASDIEAMLRFVERAGVRVVLAGGAEAWLHADALAAADIPVLVDPLRFGPGSFDQLHARPDNAALLEAAGVRVGISSFGAMSAPRLAQLAGNAVREGMSHKAAIEAITSVPAQAFGLADRGVVAEGAVGNLVVWSGDPLELDSEVLHVFVEGRRLALDSRHTRLHERYAALPGTPLPALPLPAAEAAEEAEAP